jgi:hypothetical protein
MNNPSPLPPSDSELDRLLAGRLRRTSPEFEQRWRALRQELAGGASPRRLRWPRWLVWPGLALAAAGVFGLVVLRSPTASGSRRPPVTFEELIAFEASLARASVLLEPENRDALLHLPAQPPRL